MVRRTPELDRDAARLTALVALLTLACALLVCVLLVPAAKAGPGTTKLKYAPGEIVPIPAAIPHEEGDMVDRRIVPDLRWIAQRYPIYVSDGYSGPLPSGEHVGCNGCHVKHSDHYNGLAVDIVPLEATTKCDGKWAAITRLARWAEPRQNRPLVPFRWVGYNGDAGHGCGNHLHLSWNHAPAPHFALAEWVEVFPVTAADLAVPDVKPPAPPAPETPPTTETPPVPRGPSGGFSKDTSGGVAPRGFGD
ncbi:MAG TPA: hypothetical protein VF081_00030 [Solirubrobacterales bacterium]